MGNKHKATMDKKKTSLIIFTLVLLNNANLFMSSKTGQFIKLYKII